MWRDQLVVAGLAGSVVEAAVGRLVPGRSAHFVAHPFYRLWFLVSSCFLGLFVGTLLRAALVAAAGIGEAHRSVLPR